MPDALDSMEQARVPLDNPDHAGLPGIAYRSWFLFVLMLVSASVVGERFLLAVMVGPIKADLHLSDTRIGLAKDMAVAIIYIIAVIPLARLADRWSKRKIVALSAVVWSLAVVLCGLARSFAMLVAGRAAIGLGEGGFTPASQSWIADLFPIRQRATALAVFLFGASLGNFTGPALGGWLAQAYGWRHAMMLASIPGFVLVPVVWLTLRDVRKGLADRRTLAEVETRPFGETIGALVNPHNSAAYWRRSLEFPADHGAGFLGAGFHGTQPWHGSPQRRAENGRRAVRRFGHRSFRRRATGRRAGPA